MTMTSLAAFLPAWSSIFLVATLVALYASAWLIQIISVETITAVYRLLVRGYIKVGGVSLRGLACHDIALQQPQHLGGHVVFRAKSVSLHFSRQMLKGEPLHVIVDRPWVNGLTNDNGQLHLLTLLQEVGLVREVRAAKKPGCPVCGPKGDAYATECHCTASHVAAPRPHHGKERASPAAAVHQEHQEAGMAGAGAEQQHRRKWGGANIFRRHKREAVQDAEAASAPAQQAPEEDDAAAAALEMVGRESSMSGGTILAAEPPSPHAEQRDAGTAEPSGADEGLCEQRLSGTVTLPFVQVQLADGSLVVHEEIGMVFGGWVRLKVFLGTRVVRQTAQAMGSNWDWVLSKPLDSPLTGRPLNAFGLKLETENMETRCSGWRTSTGFLLRHAANATINFTPALAKYGLARLHPLLAHAMALREANSITACATPLALHFPCDALTVRVLPLKLQIKGNRIFRGATRLLEGRKRGTKGGRLECWTSAIEADVFLSGQIVSKRMDVLVSRDFRVSKAPLHLAMWGHGRVDIVEGSIIDATVGIPAYTLRMAGLRGLPDDYFLQLGARGSAYRPTVDWLKATKALGGMVVDSAVPTFGLKGVRSWLDKRAEKRVAKLGAIPAPTPPLPWEYFRRMPQRQSGMRRTNFKLSNDTPGLPPPRHEGDGEAAQPAERQEEEHPSAPMAQTHASHPDADHTAGIAAVPHSSNAPQGLDAPEEEHGDAPPGTGASEGTTQHSSPGMTPDLAAEIHRLSKAAPPSSSSAHSDSDDESSSDSEPEDWVVEDGGRLVPGRNLVSIGHLSHEQ